MDIKLTRRSPDTLTLHLEGRFDAASAASFRTRFNQEVGLGLKRVLVDLREVSFIDSSGLSALVNSFKVLRDHQGEFALVNVQPQARIALELTRLDQVFTVYESEEAAFSPSSENHPLA